MKNNKTDKAWATSFELDADVRRGLQQARKETHLPLRFILNDASRDWLIKRKIFKKRDVRKSPSPPPSTPRPVDAAPPPDLAQAV